MRLRTLWRTGRRRGWLSALSVGGVGLAVVLSWNRAESWPVARRIAGAGRAGSFRPDGRTLDLELGGSVVREVDLATGAERTLPFAQWPITTAVSRAGRLRLDRLFNDPTDTSSELRVVDTATNTEVHRLVVQPAHFFVRFAADGGSVLIFLVRQQDNTAEVRTWDLRTGAVTTRSLTTPPGATGRGYRLYLPDPDGRTLAYFITGQAGFQLWDVATDQPRGELLRSSGIPAFTSQATWAFTPDGRFLLAGLTNGRVAVWDVARQTLDQTLSVQGSDVAIDYLRVSPDGRMLATAGYRPPRTFVDQAVWFTRQHLSPATNWRSTRSTVLIDFPSGRRLAHAEGAVEPTFSPDGCWIALREWDGVSVRSVPTAIPPGP